MSDKISNERLQEWIDEIKIYKEKYGDVSNDAADWLPFPFDETINIYQELLDLRKEKAELQDNYISLDSYINLEERYETEVREFARFSESSLEQIKIAHETIDNLRKEKAELIAIADKMATLLSDGKMPPPDALCIVDYYHARDAVYEYSELLQKTKGDK